MAKKDKHTEVDESDFIGRGFTASDMLCLLKAGAAKGVRAAREGGSVPADSLSVLKEEVETASPPKILPTVSITGRTSIRGGWERSRKGLRLKRGDGFEVVEIKPTDDGDYVLVLGDKLTVDYLTDSTPKLTKEQAERVRADFAAQIAVNQQKKTRRRPTRLRKASNQTSKSTG